ncbi:MAG: hypothetical protein GC150_02590 [Rhizobiales bacterium]|nr:hypothetical protein [Hyphomicrobiales bacterium]
MARTARRRLFVQLFGDFSVPATLLACLLAVASIETRDAMAASRFTVSQSEFATGPAGPDEPFGAPWQGGTGDLHGTGAPGAGRALYRPDALVERSRELGAVARPRSENPRLALAPMQPSVGRVGVAVPRANARAEGDRRLALVLAGVIFSAMSVFTLVLWRTVFPAEARRTGARNRSRP